MSRRRCDHCGQSKPEGTAAVYCHTYYQSGLHVGTRVYLCAPDFKNVIAPLVLPAPLEDVLEDRHNCVLCGIRTNDDPYYYYFTWYLPGMDRADGEALLCGNCHTLTVQSITSDGIRLPERELPARARETTSSAWNLLAG